MSDATDRIQLGRTRLADASTRQHESDAKTARAYAENILRSDPLTLTVAEAVRRPSVGVSTIRATIADKRLPCVRLVGRKASHGRRVLVRTADVDALLRDPLVACATGPQMRAYSDETGLSLLPSYAARHPRKATRGGRDVLAGAQEEQKVEGGCHD